MYMVSLVFLGDTSRISREEIRAIAGDTEIVEVRQQMRYVCDFVSFRFVISTSWSSPI